MPKEDSIEVPGKITDVLPNGMFRVEMETARISWPTCPESSGYTISGSLRATK